MVLGSVVRSRVRELKLLDVKSFIESVDMMMKEREKGEKKLGLMKN